MNKNNSLKIAIKRKLEQAEENIEIPASAAETFTTSMEATTPEETLESSSFLEMLHILPLIGDFIRGGNFLLQAIYAILNKDTPQRKTKIGAGIFGGIISIGTGIVGSLFLAGIGLLATGSALVFVPIVLASAVVGVYTVALYRDNYSLYQLEHDFSHSNDEFAKKALQKKITKTQWSIATNLVSTIALTLLLAALFATGVGAVVLAITAGMMVVASTAKRIYDARQDFTKAILIIGFALLVGAVLSTGFGALALGALGMTAVASVIVKKIMDRQTVKVTSIQDNVSTKIHHQPISHDYPTQSLKKIEIKTPRHPVNPDQTHVITGSHASIFDHHSMSSQTKPKNDEEETDKDKPHIK